jgi:hypothetical protein
LSCCVHLDLFPSGFPTMILYIILNSPIYDLCPAHLFLDLNLPIILGKECKLCNVLQPPVTSPLLGRNILLGTLFSSSVYMISIMQETTFYAYKRINCGFVCFDLYVFKQETIKQKF